MTIEFASHVGRKAPTTQQTKIVNALTSCAESGNLYGLLNLYYNNQFHMGQMSSMVYMPVLLQEIQEVANSTDHAILVMGSAHTDTYGHPSQLIVQYNPADGMSYPVMAQDTYIRIQLYMPKSPKHYRMLFPGTNYHFLVDAPMIIEYPLGHDVPIQMFHVPDDRLLPKSIDEVDGGSKKKAAKTKKARAPRKKYTSQ
jgi:hypothetical protein